MGTVSVSIKSHYICFGMEQAESSIGQDDLMVGTWVESQRASRCNLIHRIPWVGDGVGGKSKRRVREEEGVRREKNHCWK